MADDNGDGIYTYIHARVPVYVCTLYCVYTPEWLIRWIFGTGLTAYEAFGLYYMKLAQTSALKGMQKNVLVAMAQLSYHGQGHIPANP